LFKEKRFEFRVDYEYSTMLKLLIVAVCSFFEMNQLSDLFQRTVYDLPIIINSYVRNSVDETTLDFVAFLREFIMIRDSSLTLSGMLSSDDLNQIISHVCTN